MSGSAVLGVSTAGVNRTARVEQSGVVWCWLKADDKVFTYLFQGLKLFRRRLIQRRIVASSTYPTGFSI